MEIVVIDVDGTLVIEGRLSRFFFKLASYFQALGRRRQHPNRALLERLANYEKVVVLTGRDVKDVKFTADQLKRAGLKFEEVICAPRKELLTNWKIATVRKMNAANGLLWVDDAFRDSSLREAVSSIITKISTPEDIDGKRRDLKKNAFEGL